MNVVNNPFAAAVSDSNVAGVAAAVAGMAMNNS